MLRLINCLNASGLKLWRSVNADSGGGVWPLCLLCACGLKLCTTVEVRSVLVQELCVHVCVFGRYMMERRWYEQWKEFVETGDQNSSSFPGQIDNTELFAGQFSPLSIKQTLLLLLLSLTPLVCSSSLSSALISDVMSTPESGASNELFLLTLCDLHISWLIIWMRLMLPGSLCLLCVRPGLVPPEGAAGGERGLPAGASRRLEQAAVLVRHGRWPAAT